MSRKLSLLIVFVSSFCLMVIELVAGRLMAPYLGVSLYTWTSIIGVVLAGISLGNYLGGKIADKHGSREVLGSILFLSGFTSLLVRFMVPFFGGLLEGGAGIPLLASTLIFAFFVFFPTSLFLGCISPIVVKIDLKNLDKTGNTVGGIYAFSTLGSILGTFATGYFLISFLGTKTIILGISIILFLLGTLIIGLPKKFFKSGAVLGFLFVVGSAMPNDCLKETNYYCVNIRQVAEAADEGVFRLKLDHLVHSYVDLNNANNLEYSYEKIYAILTDYYLAKDPPAGVKEFSTFFLGGGGYTMPRYLEANYPASKVEVAEIDPGVTRANFDFMGLSKNTKIFTANEDARIYLTRMSADKKYDLIFGDAFNDYAVPYHLVTREFNELVKKHLDANGYYAVNIIDDYQFGRFISSYIKTMKETFDFVYLAPLNTNWKRSARNTFVVIAGQQKLDLDLWQKSAPRNVFSGSSESDLANWHYLVSDFDVDSFINIRKSVFLTDDYVPVDNLLAPVFKDGY